MANTSLYLSETLHERQVSAIQTITIVRNESRSNQRTRAREAEGGNEAIKACGQACEVDVDASLPLTDNHNMCTFSTSRYTVGLSLWEVTADDQVVDLLEGIANHPSSFHPSTTERGSRRSGAGTVSRPTTAIDDKYMVVCCDTLPEAVTVVNAARRRSPNWQLGTSTTAASSAVTASSTGGSSTSTSNSFGPYSADPLGASVECGGVPGVALPGKRHSFVRILVMDADSGRTSALHLIDLVGTGRLV